MTDDRATRGDQMRSRTQAILGIAVFVVGVAGCTPDSVPGIGSTAPTTVPPTTTTDPSNPATTTIRRASATTIPRTAATAATTVPATGPTVTRATTTTTVAHPTAPTTTAPTPPGSTPPAATNRKPLFVHYYLWWDSAHWKSKVGTTYAATTQASLPATLAANGCTGSTRYTGDTLLDVPAAPSLYSQDDSRTFVRHVQEASAAGIDGFVVSWSGSGTAAQTAATTTFSRRLAMLVSAVAAHNAVAGARPFKLMIGYQGLNNSRSARTTAAVANDLAYFVRAYASSPVFRVPAYGTKPVVMFLDSRKFSVPALHAIIDPLHRRVTFVGDEHGLTDWNRGASAVFDGDGWYWSSQNPYTNPGSFEQLRALSGTLHAEHKLWFSPLAAGYNKSNFGLAGSCVPRNGTQTLRMLYSGNATSNPDGWMLISWNEFLENTYIEPSLRYGAADLVAIRQLLP